MKLGSATLAFTAASRRQAGEAAQLDTDVSVRPAAALPGHADRRAASTAARRACRCSASCYPEYRTAGGRGLAARRSRWPAGLTAYLDDFPHGCTEQLVSQAMPALVLRPRPEFGRTEGRRRAQAASQRCSSSCAPPERRGRLRPLGLASRRRPSIASVYALHFLIEASERGHAVPAGHAGQPANGYLQQFAASRRATSPTCALRAYAVYLLTRQGRWPRLRSPALQRDARRALRAAPGEGSHRRLPRGHLPAHEARAAPAKLTAS